MSLLADQVPSSAAGEERVRAAASQAWRPFVMSLAEESIKVSCSNSLAGAEGRRECLHLRKSLIIQPELHGERIGPPPHSHQVWKISMPRS